MGKGRNWKGRKFGAPPEGEGFIWHTRELLQSQAWRSRSINCVRLLEFLEIEHLAHGGLENGALLAPFDQLQRFGIARRLITCAVQEAEAKGLLAVKREKAKGTKRPKANRYRLTYLWTRTDLDGVKDWQEPSDNWRRYRVVSRPRNVVNIGSRSDTVKVPHREPKSVSQSELPSSQALEKSQGTTVHEVALLSRSWTDSPVAATPKQRGRSAPTGSAVASPRVSHHLNNPLLKAPNGRTAA